MAASITRENCTLCNIELELDEPHVVERRGSRHINEQACLHAMRIANLHEALQPQNELCLDCECSHPADIDCEGEPLEIVSAPEQLLRMLDDVHETPQGQGEPCLTCCCPHPADVDCEGEPLEIVNVPEQLLRMLDEQEDEIVAQAIQALKA